MDFLHALILGIVQGLSEYLPVSSSGHLVLGAHILGTPTEGNLLFNVVVHAGTSLSSIIIFRKTIVNLIKQLFKFRWNPETDYLAKIAISMIPIGIVGVFFKDEVEELFEGNVSFVGFMLIITGFLLLLTIFVGRKKNNGGMEEADQGRHWSDDGKVKYGEVSALQALVIGVAQTIAVIPGISRSGSTISTALISGVKKTDAAKFSFLMVIPPIMGEMLLDMVKIAKDPAAQTAEHLTPLIVGFFAAFLTGLLAVRVMLAIVRRGKLYWFSFYCFIVGIIAILYGYGIFG